MDAPAPLTAESPLPQPVPAPGRGAALAIPLMLLAMLLFSLNDVMGKVLVATYPPAQVLLIRSAAALLILLPLLGRRGIVAAVRVERPGLHVLRALFSTLDVICFYTAVIYLPLADVMAFYLAAPIFVAAMSPWLLKERVGWRRWSAIAVGFVGVVIALNPSAASLELPALLSLAGSLFFALLIVTTRSLGATTGEKVMVLYPIAGALVAGLILAPFSWVPPTGPDLLFLGLLGVISMSAYFCVNRSLKLAPAASVAPYQYTLIVWAILFGYPVFGDVPTAHMLIGAAIIIAAGLFIFWREQKLAAGRGTGT
jgi:drug/metabolite transporter (DMT)-like permease